MNLENNEKPIIKPEDTQTNPEQNMEGKIDTMVGQVGIKLETFESDLTSLGGQDGLKDTIDKMDPIKLKEINDNIAKYAEIKRKGMNNLGMAKFLMNPVNHYDNKRELGSVGNVVMGTVEGPTVGAMTIAFLASIGSARTVYAKIRMAIENKKLRKTQQN